MLTELRLECSKLEKEPRGVTQELEGMQVERLAIPDFKEMMTYIFTLVCLHMISYYVYTLEHFIIYPCYRPNKHEQSTHGHQILNHR